MNKIVNLLRFTFILVLVMNSLALITAANASQSISLPSSFNATTSFSTVSGISVSNYTDVQATISVVNGYVKIGTTSNLSVPTGYGSAAWTSDTSREIAFSGTQSAVNTALASLQYKASAIGVADTITVTTFVAGSAYNSANGNFYEVIDNGSAINWEDARCKAKYGPSSSFTGTPNSSSNNGTSRLNSDQCNNNSSRRTLGGLNGYLATITSLDEHNFIRGKLSNTGWIGGSDLDSEGTFVWMDGPERGQVFWTPSLASSNSRRGLFDVSGAVSGFTYGSGRFNYFSDGEPNDAGGREHFAEFGFGTAGVGGSWNDCQNACNRTRYIVEYGDDGGSLSGASGTIAVRTVPTAPTSLIPTAGALQANLNWTSPTSDGGTAVLGYLVEYKASSGNWTTATANTGSAANSYTVTGLSAGTTYSFRVSAINAAGTSPASAESPSVTINRASQTLTITSLGTSSKTYP
jgi:hypothetical protein